MVGELAHAQLIPMLVEAVPEFWSIYLDDVDDDGEPLTHVLFGVDLTPYVLDAHQRGRSELVQRCLTFFEHVLTVGDKRSREVIVTSFVYQVGPWDPEMASFISQWPPALAESARQQGWSGTS
ncbi:hypothetical protein [Actinomadura sp. HBU206391]|uniref:DUF7674 family protein n=1 Tax=Actinomadura sp. HBU206391 TaxID=2731692 RepID=UPI00164F3857|nr:hypothetical protein [Actinomadura sp. HBU206391]MBC6460787.1 hypothetical protein [Actinomadura sp. HBU206391]